MKRAVRILKGDWDRLRRAYPDTAGQHLLEEIAVRGYQRVSEEPQEHVPSDASPAERLGWLRRWTPRLAASVSTLGYELVRTLHRAEQAARMEQLTYERDIELKKEVVPELKLQARDLRREMRELEEQLRSKGVDPDTVGPPLPTTTIGVEHYQPPRFETNESRRRTTVEFFHRLEEYEK